MPSEEDFEEAFSRFICEEIPVFGLIGEKYVIHPDELYDIDDDARLVYRYLQVYKNGRINSLYCPGNGAYLCSLWRIPSFLVLYMMKIIRDYYMSVPA